MDAEFIRCSECSTRATVIVVPAAEYHQHVAELHTEPAYDGTLCDACQQAPNGHGHWAMFCEPCSELPYWVATGPRRNDGSKAVW